MKLLLNYYLLLILVIGCSQAPVKVPDLAPSPEVSTPDVVVTFPEEKKPRFVVNPALSEQAKKWLFEVAKKADCVLDNEEFLKEVAATTFTSTKLTPAQVAQEMRRRDVANVSTYHKRFSLVIAARDVGTNNLYFNTAKNPTKMEWMVNSLTHEWLHLIGFDHVSANDSKSVPYLAGGISEKYVKECP